MKADLDRLMAARELDAFIVVSNESYSAIRDYLTNGARVTGGHVLKKRGEPMMMIVNGMEVEEAKASGLTVYSANELGYYDLLKDTDATEDVQVRWWRKMLQTAGIQSGRVGVYGVGDLNVYLELFTMFRDNLTEYDMVGDRGLTLFDEAMITKDADEIARIQSVADRTNEVIRRTWDFIASHRPDGEYVVNADGERLTIGAVRSFVRAELLARNLEDTGMIFAQGRDAGFPHSRGQDDMPLMQGQSIVFDLFPREFGGGYHHDMTRTWSIGYATEAVQIAYNQVMEAFDRAIELTKVGASGADGQNAVLDYFESLGHPTTRTDTRTDKGYVHSLGHGVGVRIHERPRLSHMADDTLAKGHVITVEPGLYYPEDGYGVRIEDMLYFDENGALITLTDFPKDLVLPLRG